MQAKGMKMIADRGFVTGGQMMIGLPGSTLADELRTAKIICECGALEARIYPTVVFYDTELCNMDQYRRDGTGSTDVSTK